MGPQRGRGGAQPAAPARPQPPEDGRVRVTTGTAEWAADALAHVGERGAKTEGRADRRRAGAKTSPATQKPKAKAKRTKIGRAHV